MRSMPEDVYPESEFRLPLVKREDLDEEDKKIYDKYNAPGARTAGGKGPLGIQMYVPREADLNLQLNQYIRFHTGIDERIRELAVLATAREMNAQYEWAMHETQAVKTGISQEIVDIVKFRKSIEGLEEKDAIIIQLIREVLGEKRVTSETFARALKIFGKTMLVSITCLIAMYCSTAIKLAVFDAQPPEDRPMRMPIP